MMTAESLATGLGLPLDGRRVVVAGLATSGTAAVRFLVARGAEVVVSDRREAAELGAVADEARRIGAILDLGGHTEQHFTGADLVVVSPGVPMSMPALEAARRHGVPVIAEVELASRFLRGRLCGITGSNGKSTTTALAAAMLTAAGIRSRACGNIGVPLVEMVESDTPESIYAVELSSFQLEGIVTLRCHAAAVLNLSPDHLDRHGDFDSYAAAKARIFLNQRNGDLAVLNAGEPATRDRLRGAIRAGSAVFSSVSPVAAGAFRRGDELVFAGGGKTEAFLAVRDIPIPGGHNVENVLAAAVLARHFGAGPDAIARAVREFRALPHRLERVAEAAGVAWYNDSKATNVDAAAKALAAFAGRRVILILGGRDKKGDFAALRPLLTAGVGQVLTIGEAAPVIEKQIEGAAPVTRAITLEAAVRTAAAMARPGDVVLLAPACASFDQFRNYEHRGETFRELALARAGIRPGGGKTA
jgi:UDP-N-acetylmuramoylalanine--D-glutamate ligase